MLSHPARRFQEADEAFGAPVGSEKLNELSGLLTSIAGKRNVEPDLRHAMEVAEKAEGDLYTDVLEAAFADGMVMADFDAMRAFFHAAALFGEVRYASRVLSEMHLQALLRSSPTGGERSH